jgi:hypothetical protein
VVAKQGRNERCRCGSGLKAKYCCDSPCGPSPDAADRSFLTRAIRDSIPALVALRANGGPSNYIDDVLELPAHFPELVVSLPALVDPELDALLFACEVGDGQAVRDVIAKVSRRFHTVAERARLARVIVRLREEESIDEIVAVLALVDLRRDDASALLEAAVLQAARIRAGRVRTPSGLLIAS